jgi:hypothetical protein
MDVQSPHVWRSLKAKRDITSRRPPCGPRPAPPLRTAALPPMPRVVAGEAARRAPRKLDRASSTPLIPITSRQLAAALSPRDPRQGLVSALVAKPSSISLRTPSGPDFGLVSLAPLVQPARLRAQQVKRGLIGQRTITTSPLIFFDGS